MKFYKWACAISTHSLTRRLTPHTTCNILERIISTHSLTRRLTTKPEKSESPDMYFNSQPHKEADTRDFFHQVVFDISTHSLTRRLTSLYIVTSLTTCISTHSLTRRLTMGVCKDSEFFRYFNSQPHKEADTVYVFLCP